MYRNILVAMDGSESSKRALTEAIRVAAFTTAKLRVVFVLDASEMYERKKPTYRVANCHEYNQSLKKRGKISLYFPDGDLKSQFINASPYTRGVSGRTPSYRAPYIRSIGCSAGGCGRSRAICKITGRPWAWTSRCPALVI
jgi:Universal stress protein family